MKNHRPATPVDIYCLEIPSRMVVAVKRVTTTKNYTFGPEQPHCD
ncbi:hypothetical protein EVA_16940 [gut metagenome]|uniref:Uncharacterized protein n=1 Tax=gut metagenome TaxID=749906 RepID=J9FZH9_9ZZZZ